MLKRICIIDGQGGGIGAALIKYLKDAFGENVELIALGTNAIATAQMLKSGANKGASGENAPAPAFGPEPDRSLPATGPCPQLLRKRLQFSRLFLQPVPVEKAPFLQGLRFL